VLCAPGEFLFDGNASVDIWGGNVGNFLRITAGSNVAQAPATAAKKQIMNRYSRSRRFGEDYYRNGRRR
jgi:hypothetical protein